MLSITDLTYRIAGRALLEGASAQIPDGWKIGLVGRNGTGKSALFGLSAGELQADGGALELKNRARLGLVAQEAPGGDHTAMDVVLAADTERARLLAESDTETDGEKLAEIHIR